MALRGYGACSALQGRDWQGISEAEKGGTSRRGFTGDGRTDSADACAFGAGEVGGASTSARREAWNSVHGGQRANDAARAAAHAQWAEQSYYRNLAATDPVLTLAGLRIELETLARNLAKGWKLPVSVIAPLGGVLTLRDAHAITPAQMELARQALHVCNQAIHGKAISREQAEDVIDSVAVLAGDYLAWLSWGFPDDWKPIHAT
jgi:hypothetical protein